VLLNSVVGTSATRTPSMRNTGAAALLPA